MKPIRYRKLVLESLEQRQLLAASPLANPVTVALATDGSATQTGQILHPGNTVAYRFTAPVTGTMVVRESPAGSSAFPTALALFDAGQHQLASIYNEPAGNLTSRVVVQVTKGSIYYAQAAAAQGAVGSYRLQFVMDDVGDTPALAANISLINSGAVNLIGSATQSGKINYAGDADIYKFTAVVPGSAAGALGIMTIRLAAQASALRSVLDVYGAAYAANPAAAPLAENSANASATPFSQVQITVTSGSVYYLKAAGFSSSTGAYQFQLGTVKAVDPFPDTFAGADAAWRASPFVVPADPANATVGPVKAVSGLIAYPGDADYIRFVAPVTGSMTIQQIADATQASKLDSYLYVYDAKQHLIVANDNSGATSNLLDSRVQFSVQAGVSFYLKAAAFGNSTGAYRLLISTHCTTSDDFPQAPPFSDANPAAEITLDASSGAVVATAGLGQPGSIDYLGDVDWFSFSAPYTGTITVQETQLSGGLSAQVSGYALDAAGNPTVLLSAARPGPIATFNVTSGSTYYLKAAADPQTAGRYVIQTSIIPAPAPPSTIAVVNKIAGIDSTTNPFSPPDTHAAVGPTTVVETVNTAILITSKTGTTLVPEQQFSTFFSSLYKPTEDFTDPQVIYDEGSGRFYICILEGSAGLNSWADLDFAVSKTSDPTQGFYFTRISAPNENQTEFPDFPKMGYNSDAIFISFNNFAVGAGESNFDHNLILTIAKDAALLTGGNLTTTQLVVPQSLAAEDVNILIPARMHGDSGNLEYFVQMADVKSHTINVIAATNYLTSMALAPTTITVAPFSASPGTLGVPQSGIDDRMLSVDWRNNLLVAAHNVGVKSLNLARWYEFSTNGTPTLVQQGTVKAGTNISTNYPSVAFGLNGEIGMTFIAESAGFPLSMEITGRLPSDPLGTMESPSIVFRGIGKGTTSGDREGDYSAIQFDAADGTFWAANEYQFLDSGDSGDWGTGLVNFKFGAGPLAANSSGKKAAAALFSSPIASQNDTASNRPADLALLKYLATSTGR
jgi:hypothetical protein